MRNLAPYDPHWIIRESQRRYGHRPLCRRKLKRHSIGAAVETAFTLPLQLEYPIATQ